MDKPNLKYRILTRLGADRGAGLIRTYLTGGDPFFRRWQRLASWISVLDNLAGAKSVDGQRVLVFSVLPYWTDLALAVATTMAARGSSIHFVWLPYLRYDIPFSLVTRLHDLLARGYPSPVQHNRLKVTNLLSIPSRPLTQPLKDQAMLQSTTDAAYMTRRGEINLHNLSDRMLVRHRYARNSRAMGSIQSLIETGNYDSLLTPHGNILEFGAVRRVAQAEGLNPVTFEFWDEENTIMVSSGEPCVLMDTRAAWKSDFPHTLDSSRRARVQRIMRIKEGSEWGGFNVALQWSQKQIHDPEVPRIVDRTKPVFLMCPGAAWDALHWNEHAAPFSSMLQWVRETATFFASRKDAQLLIRCHPVEGKYHTTQKVEEVVRETLPSVPENVIIISAENELNTYSLMEHATAGIVYTSTTGLEMLMRGIPVVIGGPAHYGCKGFTRDVETPEGYFEEITKVIASFPRRSLLTKEEQEMAWCYSDVCREWAKPFPWSMDEFDTDIEKLPIREVIATQGERKFGRTFDLLSGTQETPTVTKHRAID